MSEELLNEKKDDVAKEEAQKEKTSTNSAERSIEFLFDIPISVTVELGRTKLLLKDLLKLGEGAILELDKFEGEPVDILVNNKLIAKGEVVVINERFGVKIVDIISTQERVKQLK